MTVAETPLSVTEAAPQLGVSPSSVRRLIDAGALTAVNVGSATRRHLVIYPDSLKRFIEARRIVGTDQPIRPHRKSPNLPQYV